MKNLIAQKYIFLIIVLGIFTSELYAQKGEVLWNYKMTGKNIDASAAIGDIDNDGYQDIVVVTTTGIIIALDGYGREIWKTDLDDKVSIAPTIMDVTGNSGLEVLVLTQSGKIHCLDGLTGKPIWKNSTLGEIKWASMNIVTMDINGNGNIEIIAADIAGTLLCLDGNGKNIWEYKEPEGIYSAPAVDDLDGDGLAEIIIASKGTPLICLNHKGELKWRFKPTGDVLESGRKREVAAPVICDIDGNGNKEIITGMGYNLVTVNSNGNIKWSFPIKDRIDSGISVGDVDDDGAVEIYATDLSGNIFCVSKDGKEKWNAKLGGKARRSATLADVDGDGVVEIIVAGYGGKMHVFSPDGTIEESLLIKGGTNAAPVISDLLGDGGLCTVIPQISGSLVVYRWKPVIENPKILWPEYRGWASRTAGEYLKTKRKISDEIVVTPPLSYHVERQDFINNLSEIEKTRDQLMELIPQLPDSKGLIERVYYLNGLIQESQDLVKNIETLTPIKTRELRDDLVGWREELSGLLKIAKQAVKENTIIAAYSANPWAPFGGIDEIIEERTPDAKVTVEAFQGEFESAAFNLFNFSGSAGTFRVTIDEFTGPNETPTVLAEDVFILREVIDVPTQNSDLSADALPELNSGNLLVIPAWDGRQLWITINSAKLTPGIWRAKIHLKSLDVQFVETDMELSIKIWDTPLAKEQVLKLCNWSGTDNPEGTFADQIAHGVNLFTSTIPPKATFDESGEIIKTDYSDHDAYMKSHTPHGTSLFHSLLTLNGPSEYFSPTWLKAYKSFIPLWIKHLKKLGYGYEDFAFYPQDEPGLEHGKNVNKFMKWAKLVRDIDPEIRIYANPVPQITMEQLQEIEPYVDIWAPLRTQIYPKEKLEFIHSTNTLWWNYDCTENAKHLSPLSYYRGQAWMNWYYGHAGIGFYTYYQGSNYWYQPESGFEYAMIYEGKGVVTSKRWEAVRDGVEDYTLLHSLKMAADATDKAGTSKELVRKVRILLNEKTAIISDFNKENDAQVTTIGKYGKAGARKIADKQLESINAIRNEIAELFDQLQKN